MFITRKLPSSILEPLKMYYEITEWPEEETVMPREQLLAAVKNCHALWVTLADKVDNELIAHAPNLKIVSTLSVGYNHLDITALRSRGILVTNTPDVLTNTTADLAFALLLATARRIPEAEQYLRQGKWQGWHPLQLAGKDVGGATIGIIGLGRIGLAVAKRALGFDMKVLYNSRSRKKPEEERYGFHYRALPDLLKESDFVVILTPYTQETDGLIGKKELALMKKDAVLINVARGGIVDETALYNALKNNQLWAAGFDVFEQEPIDLQHPLLTLPNMVALPHIGSASMQTRMKMMALNVQALLNYAKGEQIGNQVEGV